MAGKPFPADLFYDLVGPSELDAAHEIEIAGFPSDEAASLDTLRSRQSQATDLFLGAFLPGEKDGQRTLIAYVDGTLSPSLSLTHESMSKHVPGSTSVCIHGVAVHPAHQHRGIASALLKEYLRRLDAANTNGKIRYERVLLIAHEELRPLYAQAGFEWVGKSAVVHGSKAWFEMRWIVPSATAPAPSEATQQIPAGLWEALQKQTSSRTRPAGTRLAPGASIEGFAEREDGGDKRNKYDLLCPREGCGSVILKKGVGKFAERETVQMEPANHTNPILPPIAPAPAKSRWWLVTPSPMSFENIGFSKPVNHIASEKPLKLLACAECDLGPLGWCVQGGTEHWVACERVRYKV